MAPCCCQDSGADPLRGRLYSVKICSNADRLPNCHPTDGQISRRIPEGSQRPVESTARFQKLHAKVRGGQLPLIQAVEASFLGLFQERGRCAVSCQSADNPPREVQEYSHHRSHQHIFITPCPTTSIIFTPHAGGNFRSHPGKHIQEDVQDRFAGGSIIFPPGTVGVPWRGFYGRRVLAGGQRRVPPGNGSTYPSGTYVCRWRGIFQSQVHALPAPPPRDTQARRLRPG